MRTAWHKAKVIAEDNAKALRDSEYAPDTEVISFEFNGTAIVDPFLDESGRFQVEPDEYYGEAFLKSDFV